MSVCLQEFFLIKKKSLIRLYFICICFVIVFALVFRFVFSVLSYKLIWDAPAAWLALLSQSAPLSTKFVFFVFVFVFVFYLYLYLYLSYISVRFIYSCFLICICRLIYSFCCIANKCLFKLGGNTRKDV